MNWGGMIGRAIARVLRLIRSGIFTGLSHVRRSWWRRPPFLPIPDRRHLSWRRVTAYGEDRPVDTQDLKAFLLWSDRQRRAGV
ncbi:MAG TPA: hypothetical protein VLB67_06505 [Acidimicrobiia bacterium]|nr:hypothetical protein [Acidimicrobiia bacterium]